MYQAGGPIIRFGRWKLNLSQKGMSPASRESANPGIGLTGFQGRSSWGRSLAVTLSSTYCRASR